MRQLVGVYGPHTPSYLPPDFWLPRTAALTAVKEGVARLIDHGTAARLKNKVVVQRLPRGRSCSVDLNLLIAFADKQDWAIDIVEGWKVNGKAIAPRNVYEFIEENAIFTPAHDGFELGGLVLDAVVKARKFFAAPLN